jgi:hypothetical protein
MSNKKDSMYEPLLPAEDDVVKNEREQKGTEDDVEEQDIEERYLPKATLLSSEDLHEGKHTLSPPTKPQPHVEVVAPCDLPKGYRLPVKYQDMEGRWVSGFVVIPEKGVYQSETFQAQLAEARPFMGGWVASEFDCGSNRDAGFSILSLVCKYPFVAGKNVWNIFRSMLHRS